MKRIYGGSGSGGSGSELCNDGEKLHTCTLYGESVVSTSGVACATSKTKASRKVWGVHGGSGGYTHIVCS